MFLNPAMSAALDRISERAADVRRAFTPGAVPAHDDVAASGDAAQFTLDPLSVALPRDTYLVLADSHGRHTYTRDGSLGLRDGVLGDAAGRPILGLRTAGGALTPLRVDPVDAALGRAGGARIDSGGTFSYLRVSIDPRSGAREAQRIVVGRVALARFPAGTKLEVRGDTLAAPAGVVPHTGFAGDGNFPAIEPMQRERSRVDLDESLVRLQDAYLAFDALQAAQTAKGHLGKTAMDLVK